MLCVSEDDLELMCPPFWVLGFQVCTSLGRVYGAGERTLGLTHARDELHNEATL